MKPIIPHFIIYYQKWLAKIIAIVFILTVINCPFNTTVWPNTRDLAMENTNLFIESATTIQNLSRKPVSKNNLLEDAHWPWWSFLIGSIIVIGIGIASSSSQDSGSDSSCPAGEGNCGATTITW